MNNKSNFLNLPSDLPGDARRHVPFTSIIHKPFCIIFVIVFVFSIMFSFVIPIAALADPQPEYDPVYNTEIIRLTDYVDNELTSDQQDIFYIMFGAYLIAQGAMSQYTLEDPYTTQDGVFGWFKSCGIEIYNSAIVQNALIAPSVLVQQGIQSLVDTAMGFAIKAGLYSSKVSFIDDVMNSDYYFLPFNQGLQIGINQVLANNGGLFNWQGDIPYEFTNSFNYYARTLDGFVEQEYITAVSNLSSPRHLGTTYTRQSGDRSNFVCGQIYDINDKFDLFINTSEHYVQFYGVSDHNVSCVCYNSYSRVVQTGNALVRINRVSYNPSLYSSYVDLLQYIFDQDGINNGDSLLTAQFYTNFQLNSLEFINHIYIGSSWDDKVVFSPNMDLNFNNDDILYYLQVQNDYLLDLKGIIQDLIDVTVLKPVIYDNIYDPSGNKVTPVTDQVSVTVNLPDSGISIPNNLFAPLTRDGGYISYLWYMTKPLVQYTSDFVQTMVFDGNEDFDITGPGAIVFGVISLGLIGGLVVKCLL